MAASRRRKLLRLQLGVNRKSTVTRWMNSWTVGVQLSKMKASERAERSLLTRKTRRGQRGGASGDSRLWVTRSVANLLVSAVRNAAPGRTPALAEKVPSARKVNHSGRKHLWAVQAGNRLAARRPVQQLIEKVPDHYGYLSRSQARKMVRDMGIGESRFSRFRDWWHLYSYKCRHIGARSEGRDPMSFLAGRRPRVGAEDLFDFLSKSDLPRASRPIDPGSIHFSDGSRITRFGQVRGPRWE
jgi:hypothetical protein